KTFSKLALIQHLENVSKKCPLCNGDLSNFDALNASKNLTISSLVESFKELNKNPVQTIPINKNDSKWSCSLTPVKNNSDNYIPIAELKISLENAKFVTKPSLFIAVVDKSGSMAGNPFQQLQSSLIHIMSL